MSAEEKRKGTWIKMYIGLLEDDVFMMLSDSAVSLYWKLYLLAKRGDYKGIDTPGMIGGDRGPYSFKQIAFHLRMTGNEGVLQVSLNELVDAGILNHSAGAWCITNYEFEQETTKEFRDRKEKHRESQEKSRINTSMRALGEDEQVKDENTAAWIYQVCKDLGYLESTRKNYSKKSKAEFVGHLEQISKKGSEVAKTALKEMEAVKSAERERESLEKLAEQRATSEEEEKRWRNQDPVKIDRAQFDSLHKMAREDRLTAGTQIARYKRLCELHPEWSKE